jgi:hypothetical protein
VKSVYSGATVLPAPEPGSGSVLLSPYPNPRSHPLPLKAPVLAFLAIGLSAGLLPDGLSAQQVSIAPGSRVRVRAATLVAPLVANFLEQRNDTLVFIEDGTGRGVWSFAIGQIERLERTAGQGGRNRAPTAKGAMIGAGVGLFAGVAFAASVKPSNEERQYSRPLTGLIGAGLGAALGAFIGSRQQTEQWINVPLPGRLSILPDMRGGLHIRFAF